MTAAQPRKPSSHAQSRVIQLPVTSSQIERLIDELARANDNWAESNKHAAYMADKIGEFAGDFGGFKKFFVKYLPWVITAISAIPAVADWISKLPPLPQ